MLGEWGMGGVIEWVHAMGAPGTRAGAEQGCNMRIANLSQCPPRVRGNARIMRLG
jgi:hypothetical protein